MSLRPRHLVAVAALLALCLAPGGVRAEGARGLIGSFSGVASSQLVSVTAGTSPGVVLDPILDPAITQAQAGVDSLGTSSAYARSVSPGSLYDILPGLGTLLTPGQALPLPSNPLQVATTYPSAPSADASAATLSMHSKSSQTTSSATVTNGADLATATVDAEPDTGEVTATAEAALTAVKLSDALVLNGVRVAAHARSGPGADVERDSSLTLAAITVAGQRIALAPGSLELLGTPTELPVVSPIRTVVESLSSAGVGIEYVPAADLPDGVQSAALRITYAAHPPANAGFSGLESVTVTVTVGGAIATASTSVFGAVTPPTGGVATGGSSSFGGSPSARPVLLPAPGSTGPTTGGTGGRVASTPQVATSNDTSVSYVVPGIRTSVAALYPILIVAAGLLYGLVRLSSHLRGERR